MRGAPLLAIALLTLAISGAAAANASSTQPQLARGPKVATAVLEEAVVARINQVRRGRGLHTLRTSRRLAAAADFHSKDMGRLGYFAHDSANGTTFWRRIERFYSSRGFRSWTVGENLLWASVNYSASFAVREWMSSPPHRQNILSRDWREVGIGAVFFAQAPGEYRGHSVTIVTADFGSRR